MSERWKPAIENVYWIIDFAFTKAVKPMRWGDDNIDNRTYNSGNCFKTEAEANDAAQKVKALLLSLHGECENLQPTCNRLATDLPRLTAEVFNRPDCPAQAKIAVVNRNGKAYYGHYKAAEINSSGGWCGLYEERGKWERIGNELFDASDWQNSLIERPAKLPDWCKVGKWVYLCNGTYSRIASINNCHVNLENDISVGKNSIHEEMVSARLRPFDAEEMKALVGKVVCGSEGKRFLVLSYAPNTVYFGKFSRTPEDLTLDIYKFPDGSPCGVLEHWEDGEWVK